MRSFLLGTIKFFSYVFSIIPAKFRNKLIFSLLMLESRIGSPAESLKRLYLLQDDFQRLLSERAMAYEGGEHPKHRLMKYHDFFVENIAPNSRVVDIGCGYGAVSRTVAKSVSGSTVFGVEIDEERYEQACGADNPTNLKFILGDAFEVLPEGAADTVILSNVLEHIENRTDFLKRLVSVLVPTKVLIRVPAFEREWHVPLRKELGINYYNDRTHFIEHTLDEFKAEMQAADIKIDDLQTVWGEIWAVCRPA
ncbi:class I SAM-dependent methyltransferase [Thalassospira sp. HF15]|uniref:class I SAM-dependent methyltransferase n=1 Tax=Thalassospira sp. HF15 TaxID=2722755 RepID=UPI001431B385|nr:class I SAM-dependent methyltransferase [Thalassospira sp. HF15]NIY75444.1 class I SAM-dependent methyltransferase [Thalassospira sp. HF15]